MFRLLVVTVLLFTSNFSFAKERDFKLSTGFVVPANGEGYLLYTPKNISDTDIIFIEYMVSGKIKCCVKTKGSELKQGEKTSVVSDESRAEDVNQYFFPHNNKQNIDIPPVMALIISENDFKLLNPVVSRNKNNLRVSTKEAVYDFSLCNSQEGVHLYSIGNKMDGHLYYALGYEVRPTCSAVVYSY
ncbi:hypothetical protein [Yersinia kristensenii]|uniref:hypothetical protein n=1 Tax=Yersinia kristensenii TaxID=28152 RepID=UPI0011A70322|nr:hypothetical protein [Yersinia kristensenii]